MIEGTAPLAGSTSHSCTGCVGAKQAPLAVNVTVGAHTSHAVAGSLEVAHDALQEQRPEADSLQRAALIAYVADRPRVVSLVLCEECARDLANVVGAFCLRNGGWSRLEARKRKPRAP
jgi:hypothetical protein